MTNIRRYYIPDAYYFITCVTKDREEYFKEENNRKIFWITLNKTRLKYRFNLVAYVLLHDHFHFLIRPKNCTISEIMKSFKKGFTLKYKKENNITSQLNLWQRRFWDHVIRNEKEFEKYFNYIHYNPVKHKQIDKPELWKESSFYRWMKKEYYQVGWGRNSIKELEELDYE